MWHAACAASLTRVAGEAREGEGRKGTTFALYAAAVLNSLVYLLKDSLERLQDIHNIEASMADEAAWKALPPRSVIASRFWGSVVSAPSKNMLYRQDAISSDLISSPTTLKCGGRPLV